MEHLHHQRRRRVLLLIAFVGGAACSSSSGTQGGGAPPPKSTTVPIAPFAPGVDLGGANDPGSGVPASNEPICRTNADCGGGICTAAVGPSVGSEGVCLLVCAIEAGLAVPGISVRKCLAGDVCIADGTKVAFCLHPCKLDADCPRLDSPTLKSKCEPLTPGNAASFCATTSVATP